MTPERIEQLAALVAPHLCDHDCVLDWSMLNEFQKEMCRRIARALYTEAMKDAAGEALRIGIRWAEEAKCADTSRQVGLDIAAAIRKLGAGDA
jgi:hypothetical protein